MYIFQNESRNKNHCRVFYQPGYISNWISTQNHCRVFISLIHGKQLLIRVHVQITIKSAN